MIAPMGGRLERDPELEGSGVEVDILARDRRRHRRPRAKKSISF